jgi:CheY-like chemotaxis protein
MHPILLVEDDENDVLFLRTACNRSGLRHPLITVADGQQAIDYLSGTGTFADRAAHPLPCLVLLDLNLPIKNGFEVLQWLRDNPSLNTLLIIVLTSSSAESDAHHAYTLGANSYVMKPSNPDRLQDLMDLIKRYWIGWNFPPPACGRGLGPEPGF